MNEILKEDDRFYGFTRLFSIIGLIAILSMFEENFNWKNIKYLKLLIPTGNEIKNFLLFNLLLFGRGIFFFHLRKISVIFSGDIISFYLIFIYSNNYFISFLSGIQSLILSLKQYSFYYDILNKSKERIDFKKYLRFLLLPILVYDDSIKYTDFNMYRFLLYAIRTIFSFSIFIFLFILYLLPLLLNLNFSKLNRSIEYVHFVFFSIITWLLHFYFFFVNFLRMIGILFLYDYPTYNDWWNAKNVKEFWRLWNIQTYRFIKKYIKFTDKRLDQFRNPLVFLISSILHEYVSILIFKKIFCVAFFSMLTQILLFYIEDFIPISSGNSFFWISNIIVGQPICLLFFNSFLG